MKISSYQTANLASLKQAISMVTLQRAMKQDADSVDGVIKAMEQSVEPHKGGSVDIKV
jgi:hypothetical protein